MCINGVVLDARKIELTNEAYNYLKETINSLKHIYFERSEANLIDAVLIDDSEDIIKYKAEVQQGRHIVSELDAMMNTLMAYRVQDPEV